MRTAKIGPDLRLHHSRDLRRNDGENVAQTSRNVGFLCLHVVLFFWFFLFCSTGFIPSNCLLQEQVLFILYFKTWPIYIVEDRDSEICEEK